MERTTPSKVQGQILILLKIHAGCSANRTRSPVSTEHVSSWSKIQKGSIIHSVQITQTQTFTQQAKHCQLNAVPFKAACSQTKAPRPRAEMKLKKRKIKKLNFQLIHFRRGWLVAAARNIKVGPKQRPCFPGTEALSDWSANDQGESCSPWTGWRGTVWWQECRITAAAPLKLCQVLVLIARWLLISVSYSVTWRPCSLVVKQSLCHSLK